MDIKLRFLVFPAVGISAKVLKEVLVVAADCHCERSEAITVGARHAVPLPGKHEIASSLTPLATTSLFRVFQNFLVMISIMAVLVPAITAQEGDKTLEKLQKEADEAWKVREKAFEKYLEAERTAKKAREKAEKAGKVEEKAEHQTVDTKEAIEQLDFYRGEISKRSGWMYDKYVRNQAETLRAAFKKKGVREEHPRGRGTTAIQYADSWDYLGMTWFDAGVGDFYDYHFEAVNDSLYAIKNQESVNAEDLAYIEHGMDNWWTFHGLIENLMDDIVNVMAESAYELDQAMIKEDKKWEIWEKDNEKIRATDKDAEIKEIEKKRDADMQAKLKEIEEHDAKAEELKKKRPGLRRQVEDLAKTRCFSSLRYEKRD